MAEGMFGVDLKTLRYQHAKQISLPDPGLVEDASASLLASRDFDCWPSLTKNTLIGTVTFS